MGYNGSGDVGPNDSFRTYASQNWSFGSIRTYGTSDPMYVLDESSIGLNMMLGRPVGWPLFVDYG